MVDAPYTVLIVDPDPETLEDYVAFLDRQYEVTTAQSADEALARASKADVVLLNRRLPDRSGDEVATALADRGTTQTVALLSTVDPGPDIVDLPCDDYLLKPLSESDLLDAVDRLVRRVEYDDRLAEYASLTAKRAALESAVSMPDLLGDPEYDTLCERCEALRRDLDGLVTEFGTDDFEAAFRALGPGNDD